MLYFNINFEVLRSKPYLTEIPPNRAPRDFSSVEISPRASVLAPSFCLVGADAILPRVCLETELRQRLPWPRLGMAVDGVGPPLSAGTRRPVKFQDSRAEPDPIDGRGRWHIDEQRRELCCEGMAELRVGDGLSAQRGQPEALPNRASWRHRPMSRVEVPAVEPLSSAEVGTSGGFGLKDIICW